MNKRDNNERIDASLPVKQLYSSLNSHSGYFDFTLHLYIFMIVLRQAVQRLAFLGVTGFWDASVMLAHQMLGPHVPIDADEFDAENTGPLTDQLAAATAESLAAVPTAQLPFMGSSYRMHFRCVARCASILVGIREYTALRRIVSPRLCTCRRIIPCR